MGVFQTFRAALLGLLPIAVHASHPLATWHPRDPLPQGEALYKATSGNGLTLVVGGTATNMLLMSMDGTNWAVGPSTGTRGLADVVYADGQFVAVGYNEIAKSTDGTNWLSRRMQVVGDFKGIAYGNGKFVVVGSTAGVLSSSDTITWSGRGRLMGSPGIVFAQNKFVSFEGSYVATSVDAESWQTTGSLGATPLAIAYGNDMFVVLDALGRFHRSPDAVSWSLLTSTSGMPLKSIAYGNSAWVAVGESGLPLYSTNASNWVAVASASNTLNAVTFVNGRFVAGGNFGQLLVSTNGTNWLACSEALVKLPLYRIHWLQDHFYAVGDRGIIFRSADGKQWQRCFTFGTPVLRAITYGGGLYLAGGSSYILGSTDGITWGDTGNGFEMTGLAWGNGRFVTTGPNGCVMSSPDGTNWFNAKPPGQADYLDVAFGNGRFVMGGSQGHIAVSTTGTNWLVQNLTAPGLIRRVCFGNNVFVAYDHPYEFYLSQDGTNWSRRIPATLVMPDDLAAGAGVWVGVDNRRRAIYSSDLVNWTEVPFRTSYSLLGVGYGNSTFVVVGGNGIWQSAPLVTLTCQPGPPATLTLSGPPGGVCEIQRTDSLSPQLWVNAGTITLSNTPAPWVDVTGSSNGFYRARLVH